MTRKLTPRRERRNKRQAQQDMIRSERDYQAWLHEQQLRKRLAPSQMAVAVRRHIADMGSAEGLSR